MSEWKRWRKPPDHEERRPLRTGIPLDYASPEVNRAALRLEDAFSAYFGIDYYTTALRQPQEDVFV